MGNGHIYWYWSLLTPLGVFSFREIILACCQHNWLIKYSHTQPVTANIPIHHCPSPVLGHHNFLVYRNEKKSFINVYPFIWPRWNITIVVAPEASSRFLRCWETWKFRKSLQQSTFDQNLRSCRSTLAGHSPPHYPGCRSGPGECRSDEEP